MKKNILKIFLCISFVSYSQDYLPMLQDGNAWSVDTFYCPYYPPDNETWTVTEQVTINGFVEINNITYKQLYSDDNTSCLLREQDGVVYKYFPNEDIERVLIDMNFEIGDTYPLQFNSGFHYPHCAGDGFNVVPIIIKVSEIQYQFIAGKNRKVIIFVDNFFPNSGEALRWIEGIGTSAGPGIPYGFQDVSCGSILSCFTSNGKTFFMFEATSCDNTTLSIGDFQKDKIILYPNPISNKSILQLPLESSIDQLKIYNISGKNIKDTHINSNNYILNSMDFASGIYFYQVVSNGKPIKTERFIVK